jgi:hypothetical protein
MRTRCLWPFHLHSERWTCHRALLGSDTTPAVSAECPIDESCTLLFGRNAGRSPKAGSRASNRRREAGNHVRDRLKDTACSGAPIASGMLKAGSVGHAGKTANAQLVPNNIKPAALSPELGTNVSWAFPGQLVNSPT